MEEQSERKKRRRDPSIEKTWTQATGRRHAPPPATAERLEAAAMHYLERYSASSAHLEKLLLHKVRRSEIQHGTDAVEGAAIVRALILRLQASGILNDCRYAEAKAASLRRRGGSGRSIRAALSARGIASDVAQHAISLADEEQGSGEADLTAARRLAQRRRLGPWRAKNRAEHRMKDIAALGRAGFSYDTARAVIDGEVEEGS
ncbi:MAG TPA: RecX family transcriptional regulator [Candidatus Polarisedimenticolia bacterium]|nr:RecX family transcriptional regulator [Candidatus Polarisedimenticolia bacterium]